MIQLCGKRTAVISVWNDINVSKINDVPSWSFRSKTTKMGTKTLQKIVSRISVFCTQTYINILCMQNFGIPFWPASGREVEKNGSSRNCRAEQSETQLVDLRCQNFKQTQQPFLSIGNISYGAYNMYKFNVHVPVQFLMTTLVLWWSLSVTVRSYLTRNQIQLIAFTF